MCDATQVVTTTERPGLAYPVIVGKARCKGTNGGGVDDWGVVGSPPCNCAIGAAIQINVGADQIGNEVVKCSLWLHHKQITLLTADLSAGSWLLDLWFCYADQQCLASSFWVTSEHLLSKDT